MSFATYGDVRTVVEKELDLEDETFVQDSEMLAYCHEAIHQAETIILTLCEDYFLDDVYLNLVANKDKYTLPNDIFADKIRKVVYYSRASGTLYNIRRLRRKDSFRDLSNLNEIGDAYFQYMVTNDANSGRKMVFFPTPTQSETQTVRIWYIRNAILPLEDGDEIDIPEFRSFIERYMVVRCMEKEGHPGLQHAVAMLEQEKQQMVTALKNRFPDDDDSLEMDVSTYVEHT